MNEQEFARQTKGQAFQTRGADRCEGIDMSESKRVQLTASGLGELGPRAAKKLAWRGGQGPCYRTQAAEKGNPSETVWR